MARQGFRTLVRKPPSIRRHSNAPPTRQSYRDHLCSADTSPLSAGRQKVMVEQELLWSYAENLIMVYNRSDMNEPINFVENRFHYLSPFSAHRIEIWGETFPTIEHAYQASRIKPGPERDAIKNAPSPLDAWREGQKCKNHPDLQVDNFDKLAVMEELFRAKMAQHSDIVEILKESGDRELQKVIATDSYWGTGPDGSGENRMGRLWMKLRSEIQ